MSILSENIQLLLWKEKGDFPEYDYDKFISHFSELCKIPEERLRSIMKGEVVPDDNELKMITRCCPEYEYELSYLRKEVLVEYLNPLEKDNLIKDNTMYLLDTLSIGETKSFTEKTGVNPSTVTRWKEGITSPNTKGQKKIEKYFGLGKGDILGKSVLVFGHGPMPISARKQKYMNQIEKMDPEQFLKIEYVLSKIV